MFNVFISTIYKEETKLHYPQAYAGVCLLQVNVEGGSRTYHSGAVIYYQLAIALKTLDGRQFCLKEGDLP